MTHVRAAHANIDESAHRIVESALEEFRDEIVDSCIEVVMAVALDPMFDDPCVKEPPIITATRVCNALSMLKSDNETKQ
jgi:hypothetical protein